MASALSDADRIEDEISDTTIIGSFAKVGTSSQSNTSNANVYTPLLASARSSKAHSNLSGSSMSGINTTNKNNNSKTVPHVMTKQVSRPTLELQSQNPRGQRSSVRPFFCCGSELSLVSLVDNLDLKDSCSSDKKVGDVRSSNLSDEEESSLHRSLSRKGQSSYSASYSGESRHAFVRRKLKDKHGAKKKPWSLRFRGRWNSRWRVSQPQHSSSHRFDLSHHSASGTSQRAGSPGINQRSPRLRPVSGTNQFIDLSQVQDFDRLYPVNNVDTIQIRERAEEMRAGVEVDSVSLTRSYRPPQPVLNSMFDILRRRSQLGSVSSDPSPDTPTEDYSLLVNSVLWQWQGSRSSPSMDGSPLIHTQVDFIHCLVPDLVKILSCPFYWGVMDRYEAERLLDNKPEGTFLLRDSAQEDFLFSVSFRRYNRSLHARVEQWNHRFSFDAHDPAVFSAPSVCELMEHYKDPCCCMFFEPMLTRPLPRNFPFSLQHICRAVICDRIAYDQIRFLPLPNSLKQFLQIYHYKQKVRVRRFDGPDMSYIDANLTT